MRVLEEVAVDCGVILEQEHQLMRILVLCLAAERIPISQQLIKETAKERIPSWGQMKQMLAMAAEVYDQIILDTPACLGLPDSKTISELSDGILVIVRADVTRKEDVDAVLEILDRRRLIGMVLNGVEATGSQYGYY